MASLGHWLGGGGDTWFGSPFSSDVWDPFDWGHGRELQRKQEGGDDTGVLAHAHVDWQETDQAHIFRADLPDQYAQGLIALVCGGSKGVRREEVKVKVKVEDGNILEISGERVREDENSDDKWHRVERRRGRFVRRFRMPENANVNKVNCSLDNGVLTVTVLKKDPNEETPKSVRRIDIA